MKKKWQIKSLLWVFITSILCIWFIHAQNVNTLSIESSTYTWRYFCPIDLSIVANYNWWDGFTNCQYVLQFDSLDETLEYVSRWTGYNTTDTAWQINWNLFYWEERNDAPITGTVICSKIRFTPKNPSKTTWGLIFVDGSGNLPTTNTFLHTEDLLNLSYNGADTLTWVSNFVVNYEMCPCTLDNNAPTINHWSHTFGTTSRYTGVQHISFLAYDQWWTSWSYRTNGSNDMSNYTWWAPAWMDNQEWVNLAGVSVKFIYENSQETVNTQWNVYTWNLNWIPRYTWDGNNRWYWISFDSPDLQVETPVTIVVSVPDNALDGEGSCKTSVHTTVYTGILNQKQAPTIALISPTWQNINPNVWVELTIADSRAWVDTGSVVIEILPITSWWQLIMSWSIYSWSDLHFQLTDGSAELWWASEYTVTFQPQYEFPVSSTVTISWYVRDLVWMETHKIFTFGTRADCTFYGCVNFVDIFSGTWNNLIQWHFTWSLIVVTGTLAPYPYLTWADGDIVMCGPIDESINLTWSVDIYSEWQRINGNLYPYEDLYVTGLDFTYESGVITPIY